jgi:Xaa-Pro aminopeptidase
MTEELSELRRRMTAEGVDLVVVSPGPNLRHVLPYGGRLSDRLTTLLVSRDRCVMVMPDFEAPEFASATGIEDVLGWSDATGPADAVATAFERLALPEAPRVLIDDDVPFRFLLFVNPHVGGDAGTAARVFAPMRLRKTKAQIAGIAKAAELMSAVVDFATERAETGMTEVQLQHELGAELRRRGCESGEHVIVAAGPNAAAPHHHAGERELRAGEAVLFDLAGAVDGHWGDITQQVYLGEPDEEYARAYAVLSEAQEAAVQAARPGAELGAIYRASRAVLDAAGLGAYTRIRCGHGIGREVHEPPSLLGTLTEPIEPGLVVTVEPGVYIPGRFGIRIEDTLAVTADGPRRLTRGARPLASKPV